MTCNTNISIRNERLSERSLQKKKSKDMNCRISNHATRKLAEVTVKKNSRPTSQGLGDTDKGRRNQLPFLFSSFLFLVVMASNLIAMASIWQLLTLLMQLVRSFRGPLQHCRWAICRILSLAALRSTRARAPHYVCTPSSVFADQRCGQSLPACFALRPKKVVAQVHTVHS